MHNNISKIWVNVIIIQKSLQVLPCFLRQYKQKQNRNKHIHPKCTAHYRTESSSVDYEMHLVSRYRFIKGLTQNLNLHTHLKLEYNIKSLNSIQQN